MLSRGGKKVLRAEWDFLLAVPRMATWKNSGMESSSDRTSMRRLSLLSSPLHPHVLIGLHFVACATVPFFFLLQMWLFTDLRFEILQN